MDCVAECSQPGGGFVPSGAGSAPCGAQRRPGLGSSDPPLRVDDSLYRKAHGVVGERREDYGDRRGGASHGRVDGAGQTAGVDAGGAQSRNAAFRQILKDLKDLMLRVRYFSKGERSYPSSRYRAYQFAAALAEEGVELNIEPMFGASWMRSGRPGG